MVSRAPSSYEGTQIQVYINLNFSFYLPVVKLLESSSGFAAIEKTANFRRTINEQ